jgi:uncharacterized protein (DUF1501 family)
MHHHHDCAESRHFHLTRRNTLLGLGTAMAFANIPLARAATASPARLVVIDAVGGLDGLAMIAPYGDPNLARLRASLMAPAVGTPGGMLDLGGFYGLHPAMVNLHAMFCAGEAAMVHAVGNAGLTRSHFEGQDYLQSGAPQLLSSGWLNRVLALLPASAALQSGISLSVQTPLLMQGPTIAAGWAPSAFPQMSAQTASALAAQMAADPLLGPAYATGFQGRKAINGALQANAMPSGLSALQQLGWAAGSFLAMPNGPQVACLQTQNFDTHYNQAAFLNTNLADLDGTLLALKTSLGATWANTVVMTITEFGRTAAANGSSVAGTDHGTAFAVILAGGAVQGGKVYGTWPGLSATQLYEGRDLAPTTDVRSIALGVLEKHMKLSASAMPGIFPGTSLQAMTGLVTG